MDSFGWKRGDEYLVTEELHHSRHRHYPASSAPSADRRGESVDFLCSQDDFARSREELYDKSFTASWKCFLNIIIANDDFREIQWPRLIYVPPPIKHVRRHGNCDIYLSNSSSFCCQTFQFYVYCFSRCFLSPLAERLDVSAKCTNICKQSINQSINQCHKNNSARRCCRTEAVRIWWKDLTK